MATTEPIHLKGFIIGTVAGTVTRVTIAGNKITADYRTTDYGAGSFTITQQEDGMANFYLSWASGHVLIV